jgi:LysM repeat protein
MTFFSARSRGIVSVLLVVLFAVGCSFSNDERDEKKDAHYLTGQSRRQNMDYKGAAEAFEKALEVNPHSSAAHLELGLLHAEKLNEGAVTEEERSRNLATAIYHLEKYIMLKPKSAWAQHVREQIKGCKYELAKTAPFTLLPNTVQAELERLTSTNTALQRQVEQLKLQLAQQAYSFSNYLTTLQARSVPAPNPAPPRETAETRNNPSRTASATSVEPPRSSSGRSILSAQSAPASANARATALASRRGSGVVVSQTHHVRKGETLASIARTYNVQLGTLIAVNPGIDPRRLRVGQTVKLPVTNR